MDVKSYVDKVVRAARKASGTVSNATTAQKNAALERMAATILDAREELKLENRKDLDAGVQSGLSAALLDRLELTDKRIEGMAEAILDVVALKDPVGRVIDGWVVPNGLRVSKVRVPLGVVCIIYESRPNVTADAASLCLKSGNAVILRGGKEAINSNLAIHRLLADSCQETGLDPKAIQMIEILEHEAVRELITAEDYVDVVIPRGGKSLIRTVTEASTVPVIKHYEGICHTYVDSDADLEMALRICENAKCQRPGVCNAMETMLVHEAIAKEFLDRMVPIFQQHGVELRGCPKTLKLLPDIVQATEEDWRTEYLDLILSVKIVEGLDEAVAHINGYGSHHSDCIVTNDFSKAQAFLARVDAAAVYVNASTRFTDGGEFGLGAEIGISTDKLHARGPMALEELTSYKWTIIGSGQLRT